MKRFFNRPAAQLFYDKMRRHIENRDVAAVLNCIDKIDVDYISPNAVDGASLVSCAVGHEPECTEIIKAFIKKNASLTRANTRGQTPMHIASLYGYGECLSLLLQHNGGLYHRDQDGYRPFDRVGLRNCTQTQRRETLEIIRPYLHPREVKTIFRFSYDTKWQKHSGF